ncbi:DUF4163 domain-containing protein [Pontibacter fetidus]|uniref:DUF4163 domain-containing protein n=1 Tax=Pontibacter fetidus TaxID=2700082 RepID=A0A6B2HC92_9BACT|nr:DUF4163 domain-containing protein [Pontibacter fetidus]NDK57384.1 DUF4163 domain-containing protein [Pontibacter fetidus]
MKNKLLFSCLIATILLTKCGVKGEEVKESSTQFKEIKGEVKDVAVQAEKQRLPEVNSILEVNSPQADSYSGNVKIVEKEYNYTSRKNNCSIHITYPVVTQLGDKAVEQRLNQIIEAAFGVDENSIANPDCEDDEYNKGAEKHYITKDSVLSIVIGSSWRGDGAGRSFGSISTLNLDLKTGKKLGHQDLFEESTFSEFRLFIQNIVEARLDSFNTESYNPIKIEEVYGAEPDEELSLPVYSISDKGFSFHFSPLTDFDEEIFVSRDQIRKYLKSSE